MKIKFLLFMAALPLAVFAQSAENYHIKSPDGKIDMGINIGAEVNWSVNYQSARVIIPSTVSLSLNTGQILGKNAVVNNTKATNADVYFTTPIYKRDKVHDNYNQLAVNFKGGYSIIFRAYNDGVAYRFATALKGDIIISAEEANFNFAADHKSWLPFVNDFRHQDKFNTSFEAHYDELALSAVKKDSLAFLPLLVRVNEQVKAAIMDADIEDYPGMYLTNTGKANSLKGVFAPYPLQQSAGGYANMNYVVNQRAGYIAKTKGTRNFPWRAVVISSEDRQLADNDMAQKLASPSKVAWDWWNDWNVTHVDFKAGINVPTYKYYIDFAAVNKLEYIIIDEGWSSDVNLNQISPQINLPEIIAYGKQKNVGIILWASWYAVMQQTDMAFQKFANMGVKGFKIDFIDRDDQIAVSSLYQIAQKAAKNHLVVDYHGMYKPSGLQRTFPNILNFEGVKGLENMKWGVDNQPGYDVSIPFIRMLAGPMDYTPGGMRNATKASFRPVNGNPMTQGTRSHQLAMYTIYEAPLQMLADNPTIYKKEQESTGFIAAIPTVFDATLALNGKVGEYVTIARRKGSTWYAGAMTNWDARTLNIDLSFLGPGNYKAIIFEDGKNADRDGTDYKKTEMTVSANSKLNINMASGGGWAARFERMN